MRRVLLLLLFSLVNVFLSLAQDGKASATIDVNQIKIGEQAKIKLQVETEPNKRVRFPDISKFLTEKIEVVDVSSIDTVLSNNSVVFTQTLTITSFDSGSQEIPTFKFLVADSTSMDTLYSSEAFLDVSFAEVDTAGAIKDIKAPVDTPFQNNELWSYVNYVIYLIIGVVVVLILLQLRKLQQAKPKPAIAERPPVVIPPEVLALEQLERLKKSKNWTTEVGVKDYYEELSVIIRKYIQNRFNIQALERTSGEILNDLNKRALEKELYKAVNMVLVLSDYVKFAKYRPTNNENEMSLENSFQLIQRTPKETFTNKPHV